VAPQKTPGGHRTGENVRAGAFATLERRGAQGRTDGCVVVSWKGTKRGEWLGPKCRAERVSEFDDLGLNLLTRR